MLVTIHFPKWYRSNQKILLPKTLQGNINLSGLEPCVEWVDEGYGYLKGAHDHSFTLLP